MIFLTALAYHFCLALPAAITQLGDQLLTEPFTHTSRVPTYTFRADQLCIAHFSMRGCLEDANSGWILCRLDRLDEKDKTDIELDTLIFQEAILELHKFVSLGIRSKQGTTQHVTSHVFLIWRRYSYKTELAYAPLSHPTSHEKFSSPNCLIYILPDSALSFNSALIVESST